MTKGEVAAIEEGISVERGAANVERIFHPNGADERPVALASDPGQRMKPRRTRSDAGKPRPKKQEPAPGMLTKEQVDNLMDLTERRNTAREELDRSTRALTEFLEQITAK